MECGGQCPGWDREKNGHPTHEIIKRNQFLTRYLFCIELSKSNTL